MAASLPSLTSCASAWSSLIYYNRFITNRFNTAIGVRARELEGPDSAKTIFRAKAKFFGQKPTAKMKSIFTVYLLNEKTEFILSSEIKCPKSGIFTNNYRVGRVGQSNFAS